MQASTRGWEAGAMTLTAPALVTGSELVTVDTEQAGDWQRALTTVGGRLPVGWDGAGERSGGVAGYDLVLAAPPHPERPGLVPALRRAGGAGRADPPGSRGGGAGGVGGVHLRGRNRVAHGGRPRVRLGPPALVARAPGLWRPGRHQPWLRPAQPRAGRRAGRAAHLRLPPARPPGSDRAGRG